MFTINTEHNKSIQPRQKVIRKKNQNTSYYYGNIQHNRMKNMSYLGQSPEKRTVRNLILIYN